MSMRAYTNGKISVNASTLYKNQVRYCESFRNINRYTVKMHSDFVHLS